MSHQFIALLSTRATSQSLWNTPATQSTAPAISVLIGEHLGTYRILYAYILLSQNYQIWHGYTYREGACFSGSAIPPTQGSGAQALSIFWASFPFMCTSFVTELPNLMWVTHVEKGVYLGVSQSATPPIQDSKVLALHNFWGSAFTLTPLNAERPNSAW